MNGIGFYRRKNKLAVYELQNLSHVSAATIHTLETKINPQSPLSIYFRLAEALNVTLDELLDDYDPALLKDGDRHAYGRKPKPAGNVIAVYRWEENLSLQQLADRMGVTSREWARRICGRSDASPKMLKRLIGFEGISEEEFMRRYAVDEDMCA